MSRLSDRSLNLVSPATNQMLVVIARAFFGAEPTFGGYVDDGERAINRGNCFSQILSNTFGNAR